VNGDRSLREAWLSAVHDSALSPTARHVATALVTWMDPGGSCRPSMASLGKRAVMTPRNVRKGLAELGDTDWLVTVLRGPRAALRQATLPSSIDADSLWAELASNNELEDATPVVGDPPLPEREVVGDPPFDQRGVVGDRSSVEKGGRGRQVFSDLEEKTQVVGDRKGGRGRHPEHQKHKKAAADSPALQGTLPTTTPAAAAELTLEKIDPVILNLARQEVHRRQAAGQPIHNPEGLARHLANTDQARLTSRHTGILPFRQLPDCDTCHNRRIIIQDATGTTVPYDDPTGVTTTRCPNCNPGAPT